MKTTTAIFAAIVIGMLIFCVGMFITQGLGTALIAGGLMLIFVSLLAGSFLP